MAAAVGAAVAADAVAAVAAVAAAVAADAAGAEPESRTVATPRTIFRETLPTIAEIVPALLMLAASIMMFGNPLLFLVAASFGLFPDVCSTLYVADRRLAKKIPTVQFVHALHRTVHWLPNDDPDNTLPFMLQRGPLLACEGLFTLGVIAVLFG